ncbi:hypothetical protein STENM327S_04962 [Streptomyces tendae]
MHSCPIFIPGHSLIGRVARLLSSSVTVCPEKPGSMNPAVECVTSPSRPSELFPSSREARSSGSVMTYVLASTNSPGCRMNGSSPSGSTSRVRSTCSTEGSMCGYR